MIPFLLLLLLHVVDAAPGRLSAVIVSRFVNGPFLDALVNARVALSFTYPIYVVTHAENVAQIHGYRGLHVLPLHNISVPVSYGAYSDLLVSCAFWEALESEFVLVFQSDSRFCLGGPPPSAFFLGLGYDWIGAPWPVDADWDPLTPTGTR
jgi:Protein of unknown function (DUF5672)